MPRNQPEPFPFGGKTAGPERSIAEVKRLIREGEHQHQDFKETISGRRKIAKSLVAFANSGGGRLIVGVKDNGRIRGCMALEERHVLESIVKDFCRPEIQLRFSVGYDEQKEILICEVLEGDKKPYSALSEEKRWWVYVRKADQVQQASPVLFELLKAEGREIPANIAFGENEQWLMDFLKEETFISLSAFCKKAELNRKSAIRILVNLIRMEVIQEVDGPHGKRYQLA